MKEQGGQSRGRNLLTTATALPATVAEKNIGNVFIHAVFSSYLTFAHLNSSLGYSSFPSALSLALYAPSSRSPEPFHPSHVCEPPPNSLHTSTMADKEFTYSDVSEHNTKKDLYIVVHDKVYNASSFVDEHPYVDPYLR
jgi:hypothetical protein